MTYDSCNILPLFIFMNCLCDEDYELLSDDPEVDKVALWRSINDQYSDLVETNRTRAHNALVKELVMAQSQLQVIHSAVHILRIVPDESLITILKDTGNDFSFDHADVERYHKDLDRCLTRAKTLVLNIQDTERELKELSSGKNERYTRRDADQDLVSLSKFMGFPINDRDITVSRYAAIQNLFYKHLESLERHGQR